ncbi:MAG TPA: Wzz/FepE/Etk N-terminal domain-containing protein, partial [Ignavibacteriales bacterium]|nr:Wzz/FepE/Etk N-terminal domain-containing protein [Ignavibacteriales bacterium]
MKNVVEYFIILLKWKKFLFITLLLTLIGSYLLVYFFIEEEYKASSLIIPVEEESIGGMSSMLKSLKGLPIGMGGSLNAQIDLYNTILSSRSILRKVVDKFDLVNKFELDSSKVGYKEQALLILKKSIHAAETPESAYEVEVTSNNAQLSADISNYLVQLLNEKIVELNVKKSTENRKFLENRVKEIRYTLGVFEDSLRQYQQISGLYDADEQIKDIISAYAQFETELSSK